MSRLFLTWLHPVFLVTEHGGGHGGGGEAGPPELPNIVTFLFHWLKDNVVVGFMHHWENVFFAMVVATFISILAILSSRRRALIPSGLQNLMETVVEGLDDFFAGILGKDGRHFTPFLGTLFIYIWCMNLLGLIPGFMSPTGGVKGGFNTTAALAITVFFYVQYIGMRRLGIGGYLHHMAGSPQSLVQWFLVPLNLPIHIIGELAKPLSLSLRLFGNITGEDVLIAAFAGLGITALAFLDLPIGLPLQFPFVFLAILTGTIQALVFTLLSTIYFAMMLPHEEHH
jgi:F-type H+-transporting ATPase subunit a